jgi:ParB-like chromosome segregation protein Spo0J
MQQPPANRRRIEASLNASNQPPAAAAIEMWPPGKLKPAKRNARTHNEAQIDLLANSILHFGVIKPVVTDDRGRIVAGHR